MSGEWEEESGTGHRDPRERSGFLGSVVDFVRRQPRIVASVAAACVLVGLGFAYPGAFMASLRATLPERMIGVVGNSDMGQNGALQVQMGTGRTKLQNAAMRDATAQSEYLPEPKLEDFGTAATVITVPASQGRLLRFDDAVESVFIADPSIADVRVVSSDLIYVYGKKLGLTNLMAVSSSGGGAQGDDKSAQQNVSASALVRVVMDTRPANEAVQQLSPSTPVDVNMFGKRTAIRGNMRNIDQAVDAAAIAQTYSPPNQPPINNTTLAGSNQINIRVRFAEVRRDDLRSFGIDWNVAVKGGSFGFEIGRAGASASPNVGARAKAGNFNIDLLIEALQANGALTILAEPNLTAVTGETASFLAGGEVPIPVPTGNGRDSITVQYKQFGVALSFTPILVKENRIAMKVKPEVSSIASETNFGVQGFTMPTFTVRRAESTIEMASGQTFAMAGLFQREVSRNVDKVPVLGDVPVLGPLFRSERYKRNETELVILITPYLVNPVSDGSLATPIDRANGSGWQAAIVAPDPTAKGAGFAEPAQQSGFILK